MFELPAALNIRVMVTPSGAHQKLIVKFYIATRAFYLFLFAILSTLPLFDTSPLVALPTRVVSWSSTLLRWDAFHFASIAREGYKYEYQFAFQPGTPIIMRWLGWAVNFIGGGEKPTSLQDMLIGGAIGSFFAGFSALDLYRHVKYAVLRLATILMNS
jgi:GPI mannosyltransferase 2